MTIGANQVSFSDLNTEMFRSSTAQLSINDSSLRSITSTPDATSLGISNLKSKNFPGKTFTQTTAVQDTQSGWKLKWLTGDVWVRMNTGYNMTTYWYSTDNTLTWTQYDTSPGISNSLRPKDMVYYKNFYIMAGQTDTTGTASTYYSSNVNGPWFMGTTLPVVNWNPSGTPRQYRQGSSASSLMVLDNICFWVVDFDAYNGGTGNLYRDSYSVVYSSTNNSIFSTVATLSNTKYMYDYTYKIDYATESFQAGSYMFLVTAYPGYQADSARVRRISSSFSTTNDFLTFDGTSYGYLLIDIAYSNGVYIAVAILFGPSAAAAYGIYRSTDGLTFVSTGMTYDFNTPLIFPNCITTCNGVFYIGGRSANYVGKNYDTAISPCVLSSIDGGVTWADSSSYSQTVSTSANSAGYYGIQQIASNGTTAVVAGDFSANDTNHRFWRSVV